MAFLQCPLKSAVQNGTVVGARGRAAWEGGNDSIKEVSRARMLVMVEVQEKTQQWEITYILIGLFGGGGCMPHGGMRGCECHKLVEVPMLKWHQRWCSMRMY